VGLERDPLSLMSTIEELLGITCSSFGLETRKCCHRDPLCRPRSTLYPQTLVLTSPTRGGRSVCIVRSQTLATEFSFLIIFNSGPNAEVKDEHSEANYSVYKGNIYASFPNLDVPRVAYYRCIHI
jgi:hypothetical protein